MNIWGDHMKTRDWLSGCGEAITFFGIFGGFIAANQTNTFLWSVAFTWWFAGIVAGGILLGLSTIIEYLEVIASTQKESTDSQHKKN